MKILFIGTVEFSARALHELINIQIDIVGVCTLSSSPFNSDHEDLTSIASNSGIPVLSAPDLHSQTSLDWINKLKPDIIFCFGWSQLIKEPLLSLAPLGVLGFHPAALPANRGRHPLIWALVLGPLMFDLKRVFKYRCRACSFSARDRISCFCLPRCPWQLCVDSVWWLCSQALQARYFKGACG